MQNVKKCKTKFVTYIHFNLKALKQRLQMIFIQKFDQFSTRKIPNISDEQVNAVHEITNYNLGILKTKVY